MNVTNPILLLAD